MPSLVPGREDLRTRLRHAPIMPIQCGNGTAGSSNIIMTPLYPESPDTTVTRHRVRDAVRRTGISIKGRRHAAVGSTVPHIL